MTMQLGKTLKTVLLGGACTVLLGACEVNVMAPGGVASSGAGSGTTNPGTSGAGNGPVVGAGGASGTSTGGSGSDGAMGGSSGAGQTSPTTNVTCGGELAGVWHFHQEDFPTPPTPPRLDECSGLELYRFDGQLHLVGWFNDRPARRQVTIEFAPDGTYSWQQSFQGPTNVHYPAACRTSLGESTVGGPDVELQETCEDIAASATLAWSDPEPLYGPEMVAQVTCVEDASAGCDCTVNVTSTEQQVGFWETSTDGSLILSRGDAAYSGAQPTSYCVQDGTLRFADSVLWWWQDLWGLEFSQHDCAVEAVPECQPTGAPPAPSTEVSCGGDPVGEWYAVQEDLPTAIPPQLDECLGLTLQRGSFSLSAQAWMPMPSGWRMYLTVLADGQYAAAVSRMGTVEVSYPATCLVSDAQQETCADVGAALSTSWLGEGALSGPLSCNANAEGACNCTGTIILTGGPAGFWTTQDPGQITFDGIAVNGARSFATTYCVDSDTLRFRGDSGAWWRGSSGVDLHRVDCDDGLQGPFEEGPDCGGPCGTFGCPP